MIVFIIGFLYRFFSGIKNAEYYQNVYTNGKYGILVDTKGVYRSMVCMSVLNMGLLWPVQDIYPWSWLVLIPLIPLWAMLPIFLNGRSNRVHLYENIIHVVYFGVAVLLNIDVIPLVLSGISGNVAFNWVIQKYIGNTLWTKQVYKDTELIEAKNWTWEKIRISNGYVLVLLGGFCLIGYISIFVLTSWELHLYDLLKVIFKR